MNDGHPNLCQSRDTTPGGSSRRLAGRKGLTNCNESNERRLMCWIWIQALATPD